MVDVTRVNDSLRAVILVETRENAFQRAWNGSKQDEEVTNRSRSTETAVQDLCSIYNIHRTFARHVTDLSDCLRIVVYLGVINFGVLQIQSRYILNQYSSINIESILNAAIESLSSIINLRFFSF